MSQSLPPVVKSVNQAGVHNVFCAALPGYRIIADCRKADADWMNWGELFFSLQNHNFVDKDRISLLTKITLVKNVQTTWKLVGDGLQLGSSIPFAILIGFGIGYWLDGKFDTSPYLSIIFFFFGIAAAGRNVMIELRKQRRSEYSGPKNGL